VSRASSIRQRRGAESAGENHQLQIEHGDDNAHCVPTPNRFKREWCCPLPAPVSSSGLRKINLSPQKTWEIHGFMDKSLLALELGARFNGRGYKRRSKGAKNIADGAGTIAHRRTEGKK